MVDQQAKEQKRYFTIVSSNYTSSPSTIGVHCRKISSMLWRVIF